MAPGTVTGLPTTIEESDELEEEDEGRRGWRKKMMKEVAKMIKLVCT
jgi:hypothetical protein